MSATTKTLYNCGQVTFKIGEDEDSVAEMAGVSNVTINIENTVQTYVDRQDGNWTNGLATAKNITVSVEAQIVKEDEANKFVRGLSFKTFNELKAAFEIVFPWGQSLKHTGIVTVTNLGGGANEEIAPLTFDIQCCGKPTITEETASPAG